MKKFKSIIYVNYFPYENSGKILDFLLENFENVFLFSLGFHNIKQTEKFNKLIIFHNGEFKKEYSLFQLSVPQTLLFITLPLRSSINLLQIILYSYKLKKKFGKIDTFFSVNAFTSSIGIILKKFGMVSKTVFWVWDFYPPIHRDKVIALVRKIYWYFDKWATISSDKVIVVNHRLLDLRKNMGIVSRKKSLSIISLGTDNFKVKLKERKNVVLGFIGVIKENMGLGTIFDNANEIVKNFPGARFEVIGSGPEERYFKQKAKDTVLPTTFHGYLKEEIFNRVLKTCTIGIAPYQSDPSNVSQFGDAGKVKRYISLGLPVMMTDISEFSKEVRDSKAGVIIRYGNSKDLIDGIRKIMRDYKTYQKNALKLGRKFYYKKNYRGMFEF